MPLIQINNLTTGTNIGNKRLTEGLMTSISSCSLYHSASTAKVWAFPFAPRCLYRNQNASQPGHSHALLTGKRSTIPQGKSALKLHISREKSLHIPIKNTQCHFVRIRLPSLHTKLRSKRCYCLPNDATVGRKYTFFQPATLKIYIAKQLLVQRN